MRRKSVIGKLMIDRLESATSCFDIRLDICSVDVRSKVGAKWRTLPINYSLSCHFRCTFKYFGSPGEDNVLS